MLQKSQRFLEKKWSPFRVAPNLVLSLFQKLRHACRAPDLTIQTRLECLQVMAASWRRAGCCFTVEEWTVWSLLTQCSLPSLFTKEASPTFPKDADLRWKCPHQSNSYRHMSLLTLLLEGTCWVTTAIQCSAIGRKPVSWRNLGNCFKDSLCPAHSAELTVALDGRLVGSYIKIKK